jgi:hypothetical protein
VKGIYVLFCVIILLLCGVGLMMGGIIPTFMSTTLTDATPTAAAVVGDARTGNAAPLASSGAQPGILLSGSTAGALPSGIGCYKYNQCPEGKMCVLYPNREYGQCRDGTPPTLAR